YLLETEQPRCLPCSLDILQHGSLDVFPTAQLDHASSHSQNPLHRGNQHLHIRDDYGDEARLLALSVHVRLRDVLAARVDRLDLLRSNVLALCKFENMLLPIDDLQASLSRPSPDVSSVQPSLSVQHFPSLLLILVVALEDRVTA
ncbi:hypothetical protein PMAYCL1PPCAC_16768, partial [Pristionchus mayeri]